MDRSLMAVTHGRLPEATFRVKLFENVTEGSGQGGAQTASDTAMASPQAQVLFRTCVTTPSPHPRISGLRKSSHALKSGPLVQGLGAGKTSIILWYQR